MKVFLVFLVVAALGGSATGWYLSASTYVWPEAQFGPFSTHTDLTPKELDEYFDEIRPAAFPAAEVVGGNVHDFGVMLRDAEGSHAFEVRNVGGADLELEVTGSTCKCTVGSLENNVLSPGESTTVQMNWTAKTTGEEFRQSANLRTTDPAQAEIQLEVAGKVVDRIDAVPASWNVGEVPSGEPVEVTSRVYNRYDHDLEFVEARWTQQALQDLSEVEVVPSEVEANEPKSEHQARQAFDVNATIRPGLSQGRVNATLRLAFRHPDRAGMEDESIHINFLGRIVGPISLLGGAQLSGHEEGKYVFDMKRVNVGEGRTEKVYVVFRGEQRSETPLKITDVQPEAVLSATLGEPVEQGAFLRYPLELRVKKDAPSDRRLGKDKDDYGIVTIETESDAIAPLHLRVLYSVGGPPESR